MLLDRKMGNGLTSSKMELKMMFEFTKMLNLHKDFSSLSIGTFSLLLNQQVILMANNLNQRKANFKCTLASRTLS